MDAVDLEILALIQNDARVAHASVGEKLGLTAPAVHARVKRLERDGVIRGYLTSIDPLSVNQTLLAFVRVMNSASGKDEQAFESFVVEEPNILECHDISGEDSYMLKIRTDRDLNFPLHHQRVRWASPAGPPERRNCSESTKELASDSRKDPEWAMDL